MPELSFSEAPIHKSIAFGGQYNSFITENDTMKDLARNNVFTLRRLYFLHRMCLSCHF